MRYSVSIRNHFYEVVDTLDGSKLKLSFYLQPISHPRTRKNYAFEFLTRFESQGVEIERFFKNTTTDFIKTIIKLQVNEINKISMPSSTLFTVNCCASTLADNEFVRLISSKLIRPIAIELTSMPETDSEWKRALQSIIELKKHGHQIWLDDYLSEDIPQTALGFVDWDLVKIDKELIHQHIDNPDYMRDVVSEVSDFGRRKIVFEGVETEYQHKALLKYKGLHQGYFYGRPMESGNLLRVSV